MVDAIGLFRLPDYTVGKALGRKGALGHDIQPVKAFEGVGENLGKYHVVDGAFAIVKVGVPIVIECGADRLAPRLAAHDCRFYPARAILVPEGTGAFPQAVERAQYFHVGIEIESALVVERIKAHCVGGERPFLLQDGFVYPGNSRRFCLFAVPKHPFEIGQELLPAFKTTLYVLGVGLVGKPAVVEFLGNHPNLRSTMLRNARPPREQHAATLLRVLACGENAALRVIRMFFQARLR